GRRRVRPSDRAHPSGLGVRGLGDPSADRTARASGGDGRFRRRPSRLPQTNPVPGKAGPQSRKRRKLRPPMTIVIPGGSGQVGTLLARSFHGKGHEVIVLSRAPERAAWRVRVWDAESLGDWASELEGAHVVINL